jgi:hypothetical protein
MKAATPLFFAAGTVLLAIAASGQTPLVLDSPFVAPSHPAAATAAADPYTLTGVVATQDSVRVCILEAKSQRNRWIAVGAEADGIQVESYDRAAKQAVILVDGNRRTLVLHESTATADEPVATTPEAKAKEARLLTGDLLDVGLQQRQAYAKAHGAAGN